jgi:hypothetical protein
VAEWLDWWDSLDPLADDEPTVCVTHLAFVPCRRPAPCVWSTDPDDVAKVRRHRQGMD